MRRAFSITGRWRLCWRSWASVGRSCNHSFARLAATPESLTLKEPASINAIPRQRPIPVRLKVAEPVHEVANSVGRAGRLIRRVLRT